MTTTAVQDRRADTPGLEIRGRTVGRQVIWLATPVLIEQFLLYLVGLSDTLLTGRYLAERHLAAVTVGSYLTWFLGSLIIVVSAGASALVARSRGAGRGDDANRIAQQAMGLALIVGTSTLAIGWGLAPAIVEALGLDRSATADAALYIRYVLLATPLLACEAVGVACLRGAGDTRTGMWVMILVNAINVGLSWSLVRGFGPLPALGFAGIAIGTACGEGAGGLLILLVLIRGRSGLRLRPAGLRPSRADLARIVRISGPAAGESLTQVVCQLWFLGLINRLGATATAAHGVAIKCESIAFLTVSAFSVAAGTLVGQYLGAGRPDLAARAARTAWGLGTLVLGGVGFLIYALAGPMLDLFLAGRNAQVAEVGLPLLRVVAFAMPALATINVLGGSLRGAGDTRWPWLFVIVGFLAVRLPMTYWATWPVDLGGLGLGLWGAWIAMMADLHARGMLLTARFLQGGWRRVRV